MFRSSECSYIRVLPSALGIKDKGHTKRLQRALSDFGFERSFVRATTALKEHYGFELPVSTTSRITLEHAAEVSCAENTRWLQTQKNRLKTNHPERVLCALEPYLEADGIEDAQAPVRAAHRYINNRLDQLDYAGALAEDLPIGSGLIESGHKHILQARLKISGAVWTQKNAQNLAQARTLRANRLWDSYWSKN